MDIFGWIVLVGFALFGFAVVLYAVCQFVIVQVRALFTKISGELEITHENNKKTKELKRLRLSKKRDAKHEAKNRILDARLSNLQKKTDKTVEEIEQKS